MTDGNLSGFPCLSRSVEAGLRWALAHERPPGEALSLSRGKSCVVGTAPATGAKRTTDAPNETRTVRATELLARPGEREGYGKYADRDEPPKPAP